MLSLLLRLPVRLHCGRPQRALLLDPLQSLLHLQALFPRIVLPPLLLLQRVLMVQQCHRPLLVDAPLTGAQLDDWMALLMAQQESEPVLWQSLVSLQNKHSFRVFVSQLLLLLLRHTAAYMYVHEGGQEGLPAGIENLNNLRGKCLVTTEVLGITYRLLSALRCLLAHQHSVFPVVVQ